MEIDINATREKISEAFEVMKDKQLQRKLVLTAELE